MSDKKNQSDVTEAGAVAGMVVGLVWKIPAEAFEEAWRQAERPAIRKLLAEVVNFRRRVEGIMSKEGPP